MRRLLLGTMFVSFGVWLSGAGVFEPATAAAKGKKATTATTTSAAPAAGKKVNVCGCYSDTQGNCFCGRKGKCACPGECEPKGCEEKRAKEMQKEVAAEIKKAADADKRQKQKSIDAERRESQRDRDKEKQKEAEKEKGKT